MFTRSLSLGRSLCRSVCDVYRLWTVGQFALRLNKLKPTASHSVCIESQTFCYLNLTMFMCVLAKYTIFTMIWYSDECNWAFVCAVVALYSCPSLDGWPLFLFSPSRCFPWNWTLSQASQSLAQFETRNKFQLLSMAFIEWIAVRLCTQNNIHVREPFCLCRSNHDEHIYYFTRTESEVEVEAMHSWKWGVVDLVANFKSTHKNPKSSFHSLLLYFSLRFCSIR